MTTIGQNEPVLETQRLVLRPVRIADITGQYVDGLNDGQVNRYLMAVKRTRQTRETVEAFVQSNWDSQASILFGLFVKDDVQPFVGTVRVSAIDLYDYRATIGVCLFARRAWKSGFAAEALDAVVGYLFDRLGLHYVEAGAYAENSNSIRLFERCGFSQSYRVANKARFEDRFMDLVFLSRINPDFDMSSLGSPPSGIGH